MSIDFPITYEMTTTKKNVFGFLSFIFCEQHFLIEKENRSRSFISSPQLTYYLTCVWERKFL